jgi:hypothetical protein
MATEKRRTKGETLDGTPSLERFSQFNIVGSTAETPPKEEKKTQKARPKIVEIEPIVEIEKKEHQTSITKHNRNIFRWHL